MATGSVDEQKTSLSELLLDLGKLVTQLPSLLPLSTKDRPITKNLGSYEFDIDEGPYFSFNQV